MSADPLNSVSQPRRPSLRSASESSAPGARTVEVRRSTRRRRTVSAYREGDRTVVLIPARMSEDEEQRWVTVMLDKLAAQESRRMLGDRELAERAEQLSEQYLEGRARPISVRWVTNQNTRWGSCTPAEGSIRLSHRLQGMPEYVIDYVLLHELAHLLVPGHGQRFWRLLEVYPRTERARGFLEGVVTADRLPYVPASRESDDDHRGTDDRGIEDRGTDPRGIEDRDTEDRDAEDRAGPLASGGADVRSGPVGCRNPGRSQPPVAESEPMVRED